MSFLHTTPERIVQRLNEEIRHGIEEVFYLEIRKISDVIARQAAKRLAEGIHGRVSHFEDHVMGNLKIAVTLDGVEAALKDIGNLSLGQTPPAAR